MEEKVYLDKLAKRDIKPTAIRLLILKSMMEAGRAVSQLDLETLLDTVDKSTISRTITLFLSHHLIHSIDDGSGSWKYAVCDDSCNCVLKDLHSHFYCEKCHRTFCLEKIHIPVIDLPKGFTLHSVNYVVKGVRSAQKCRINCRQAVMVKEKHRNSNGKISLSSGVYYINDTG